MINIPSPEEVEAARTEKGGWTRATLAAWGVSWPPPPSWRKKLEIRYELLREIEAAGGKIVWNDR